MDSLSRLYILRSVSTNGFDPVWPILVMQNTDKGTQKIPLRAPRPWCLIKKDDFGIMFGTLNRKLAIISLPLSRRLETIQQHHVLPLRSIA